MTTPQKPRILMLHGYGQTADKFKRSSLKNIKSALGNGYEYVYLQAPLQVTNQKGEIGYGWWTFDNQESEGTQRLIEATRYINLQPSLNLIEATMINGARVAGIIGFSQGGTFASMLCGLYPLDFYIIVSAYPALDPAWKAYRMPSNSNKILHVFGTEDTIVKPELSMQLFTLMSGDDRQPVPLIRLAFHKGKHIFPKMNKDYQWVVNEDS